MQRMGSRGGGEIRKRRNRAGVEKVKVREKNGKG